MTAMTVTADDVAAMIAELPPGVRGRRHLEALCRAKRRDELAADVLKRRRAAIEAMDRELSAELDAILAEAKGEA